MNAEEKKELIDFYFAQKLRGREFSKIRAELINKGISESDVKSIIAEIDNRMLQYEINKTRKKVHKQMAYLGLILVIIGSIVGILGYIKLLPVQNYLLISVTFLSLGITTVIYATIYLPAKEKRKANR